jgi:hypothetical protein
MDGMNKKSLKIKIRNCARANPYGCREDCPGGIICGKGHRYGSGAEISLFNYLFQLTFQAHQCSFFPFRARDDPGSLLIVEKIEKKIQYNPIFLSCSISKSIAKSINIEPINKRISASAAWINNGSIWIILT